MSCVDQRPSSASTDSVVSFSRALPPVFTAQGVRVARVLDPSAGPRGYQYYVSFLAVTTKGDVPTLVILTADTGCSAAFAPSAIGVDMSVQTHESGAQLIPGTLYYVRVRAVNSVGAGAPTAAQRVTNPALVTEVPRAKPGVPMYVSQSACLLPARESLYARGVLLTFLPLLPVHLLFCMVLAHGRPCRRVLAATWSRGLCATTVPSCGSLGRRLPLTLVVPSPCTVSSTPPTMSSVTFAPRAPHPPQPPRSSP